MTSHEQIAQAYALYNAENDKFTQKGIKASATRARKALKEISKAIKLRSKEILVEKEAMTSKEK